MNLQSAAALYKVIDDLLTRVSKYTYVQPQSPTKFPPISRVKKRREGGSQFVRNEHIIETQSPSN